MSAAGTMDLESGIPRHFVIKRGHRGRYRFAMLTDDGRITGEVRIAGVGDDRERSQAEALLRISSLAEALSLSVVARLVTQKSAPLTSEPFAVDALADGITMGDHHGEV